MAEVETEWFGDALVTLVGDATAASVIDLGTAIANDAKEIVHVQTGTLERSIWASPEGVDHSLDQEIAHGYGPRPIPHPGVYLSDVPGSTIGIDLQRTRGDLLQPDDVKTPDGAAIEVGSWVDYACVEETGRHHQFIHPAVEMNLRTWFDRLLVEATKRGIASNSGWRRYMGGFF